MLVFDKNRKKKLPKYPAGIFPTSDKKTRSIQKKKFKRYIYIYRHGKPLFFDSSVERSWFYAALTLRKRKTRKKLFFFNKRKQRCFDIKTTPASFGRVISFVNKNSFRRFGFFRMAPLLFA